MADDLNPGEQNTSPAVDWEARYKGTGPVIERLTADKKALEGQLSSLTSELEQLKAQVALKDTEKTSAISEREKQLQEVVNARASLESENAQLKALQLKVKVAKELKRPDLMAVLDTIPDVGDEEALKTIMTTLANYADSAASAREKQLMAGVTPGLGQAPAAPGVPTSESEWSAKIESMPLGSPERTKAWDDYYKWLSAKHSS